MNDKEILRMFFNRDEKAISVTSEKYGSYCLSIATNILGSREDAEECVNDAMLNAWNSIPPAEPELLSAYLGKLVRNLSFNLYKKNKAKKRGSGQTDLVLSELEDIFPSTDNPENRFDCKLLTQTLNSFLAGLSEKKRNIFICRYWYADSVKDIAKRFGMTENSVSATLSRLRKQLHNYLAERDYEL